MTSRQPCTLTVVVILVLEFRHESRKAATYVVYRSISPLLQRRCARVWLWVSCGRVRVVLIDAGGVVVEAVNTQLQDQTVTELNREWR